MAPAHRLQPDCTSFTDHQSPPFFDMAGSTIYDDGQTSSHLGSGGWIRTNDLQVMSLTSYRAALPRNKLYVLILTSYSKMSTVLSGAHDWIRTNNLQHLKLTPLPVGLHARMAFRPHNHRITGPWSSGYQHCL